MAREESNFELAAVQLQGALALLRAVDDFQGIAQTLNGLSELASLEGDYDQAARLLSESLVLLTTTGSKQDLAWVHCGLAENCWHQGDFQAALQHGEISQRLFQELGSVIGLAIALHHVGLTWLALGNLEQAAHCLHESLDLCHAEKRTFMAARCLAGLGGVAIRWGEALRAARLLGAAIAHFTAHPRQLTPADEAFYHRLIGECRAQLDDTAFLTAWATGEAMSAEENVVYALRDWQDR